MLNIELDKIRDWYQTRSGIAIPKIKLINVPDKYIIGD